MRSVVERHPVLSFVVLAYAVSWAVWFCIPPVAGGQWTLVKIWVGVGLGPGLAAVLLDRVRGDAGPITARWWMHFAAVFAAVAALNFLSLAFGDAGLGGTLSAPGGWTAPGVAGSLLAAAVCGFIFASAAASRTPSLHSILRWRAPLRWWAAALFLMPALLAAGIPIAKLTGEEIAWPALPPSFVVRSILFTLFVVGLGEEPGWRGWMLPELQKRYTPLKSCLLLGIAWGLWHFPLFVVGLYPGPADAVLEHVFVGPMMAVLFAWLYNRTGGNLLLAIVLHTAVNNSPRILPGTGPYSALLLVLIVALVLTERMWRKRSATPT